MKNVGCVVCYRQSKHVYVLFLQSPKLHSESPGYCEQMRQIWVLRIFFIAFSYSLSLFFVFCLSL